jgi:hypothetical protein
VRCSLRACDRDLGLQARECDIRVVSGILVDRLHMQRRRYDYVLNVVLHFSAR